MHLNRKSPKFSIASELLCMLSRQPLPIRELADDLGLSSQREVRAAADILTRRGFDIETGYAAGMGHVMRLRHGWDTARTIADEYWESLYGAAA